MAVTLGTAVDLAASYAKAAGVYDWAKIATLTGDSVVGRNAHGGVVAPATGLPTQEVNVDALHLQRMLNAIGAQATVTYKTARGKPSHLEVAGGGSKFRLQEAAVDVIPPRPAIPTDGWRPLDPSIATAMTAVAKMATTDEVDKLFGLRVLPYSFAVTRSWGAVMVNTEAQLVDKARTLAPWTVSRGATELAVDGDRLWLAETGGVVSWVTPMSNEFPDETVATVLRDAASRQAAIEAVVDVQELLMLLKQAAVAAESPAQVFELAVSPAGLELRTQDSQAGPAAFRGAMGVTEAAGASSVVGVTTDTLSLAVGTVAKAAGCAAVRLRVGSSLTPVHMVPVQATAAGLTVDGLIMPSRLS